MIRKRSHRPGGIPEDALAPPETPRPRAGGGDRLIEPPGAPKPRDADAVGEGNVEELAEDAEPEALDERTEDAQRKRPRAMPKDPPPRRPRRRRE